MKFLMVFERNHGLWATYVHGEETMDQTAALVFVNNRFRGGLPSVNKVALYMPADAAPVNGVYVDQGTWLKDAEVALVREFLAKPKFADPSAMHDAQAIQRTRAPAPACEKDPFAGFPDLKGWTVHRENCDDHAHTETGHATQRVADPDARVIWGAN